MNWFSDNWITVGCIVIIGVGTYLLYYGQSVSGGKILDDKVNKALNDMRSIRDNTIDPDRKESLIKAESDFRDWANTFMKNKSDLKAAQSKSMLLEMDKKIDISRKYRPLLQGVLNDLIESINAINQHYPEKIIVDCPSLPDNLFDGINKYKGTILFGKHAKWEIMLYYDPKQIIFPSLDISLYAPADAKNRVDYYSVWGFKNDKIVTSIGGKYIIDSGNIVIIDIDLKEARQSLRKSVQKLLEAQLLLIDK